MPREFTTVALWGRLGERSVAEPALQVLAHLRKRKITVLASAVADASRKLAGATHVDEAELAKRADLVVAIGGDYLAERRLMVAARLRETSNGDALFALNDVVLQKGDTGRLVDFTTEVDGTYVNTHRGDGLIVATPTGSTAYALSCSGPIIQPNVDALVMVPICPHTLSDRPLVLPSSSTIRITLDHDGGSVAHVVCDGQPLGRMKAGDTLTISLAKEAVTLLHPRDYNYYELLRSKLNWGRANRDRANTRG